MSSGELEGELGLGFGEELDELELFTEFVHRAVVGFGSESEQSSPQARHVRRILFKTGEVASGLRLDLCIGRHFEQALKRGGALDKVYEGGARRA